MNWLSLRNNQLKFKTSGRLPIILEEFTNYTTWGEGGIGEIVENHVWENVEWNLFKKVLCDDDAEHIFKRVYYGRFHMLRFSFWTNGLTGVWVGDQKVLHLELGID